MSFIECKHADASIRQPHPAGCPCRTKSYYQHSHLQALWFLDNLSGVHNRVDCCIDCYGLVVASSFDQMTQKSFFVHICVVLVGQRLLYFFWLLLNNYGRTSTGLVSSIFPLENWFPTSLSGRWNCRLSWFPAYSSCFCFGAGFWFMWVIYGRYWHEMIKLIDKILLFCI